MIKIVLSSIAVLLAACTAPVSMQASEPVAEIRLVDDIDEARGYCLDIAGGRGTSAPLDKGLQAHTCYNYTGKLLEDQSFSTAMIKQGAFKLPYFNVCMAVPAIASGSAMVLAPCDGGDKQQFSLQPDGRLVTKTSPEFCVTASGSEKKEGRGGTPVHVMRPLSLQPCSDGDKRYQVWSVQAL